MEGFELKEVVIGEDQVGDVKFEMNTARAKGFLAGASIVGAAWLITGFYKKFKKNKSEETEPIVVEESEEQGA